MPSVHDISLFLWAYIFASFCRNGNTLMYSSRASRVGEHQIQFCQPVGLGNEKIVEHFIRKVDASNITREDFRRRWDGKYPAVLTNVFDIDHDTFSQNLLNNLGDKLVEYDIRRSSDGFVETFEATLNDFIGSIRFSSHEESSYLMNEHILSTKIASSEDNPCDLNDHFHGIRRLIKEDLFNHFPSEIRPKSALIIGGSGSRSFLHADPYEWMGWNYLVEGKKLWTFFPPNVSANVFRATRNAPDAWGAYNLSAGWVSECDLYRCIVRGVTQAEMVSVDREPHRSKIDMRTAALGIIDDTSSNTSRERRRQGGEGAANQITGGSRWRSTLLMKKKRNEAHDPSPLYSALNEVWASALASLQSNKDSISLENRVLFDRHSAIPVFTSGESSLDNDTEGFASHGIQIVQEEGDLILIPPFWWHQVYHLEPSIAVASQYFNDVTKLRVFRHILRWCGVLSSEDHKMCDSDGSEALSGEAFDFSPDAIDRMNRHFTAARGDKEASEISVGCGKLLGRHPNHQPPEEMLQPQLLPRDFLQLTDAEQVKTIIRAGVVARYCPDIRKGHQMYTRLFEALQK